MNALVVYESLWGNTSSIARAIAEGLGKDARALSTAEATPEVVAEAELIVAGAPIHILGLPSPRTRKQVLAGAYGTPPSPPDLSHPPLQEWLSALPAGKGCFAAFETGVDAWYGRGAASKIDRALRHAGYVPIAKPRRFNVTGRPLQPTAFGVLCEGETERARRWGALLATAMERG